MGFSHLPHPLPIKKELCMENFNLMLQAISTVGFPIVICLIMIYILYQTEQNHKQEINEMMKALENNTIAINHLTDIINSRGIDNGK